MVLCSQGKQLNAGGKKLLVKNRVKPKLLMTNDKCKYWNRTKPKLWLGKNTKLDNDFQENESQHEINLSNPFIKDILEELEEWAAKCKNSPN